MTYRSLAICCVFLAACGTEPTVAEPSNATSLTIDVEGVRGQAGKVFLAIYDNSDEFASNGRSITWLAIPAGTSSITLNEFPEGKFAISAFHDENENNDLDMAGGAPTEGYGNSGDVGQWDDPTFDTAAFEGRTAYVKIHYLN